MTNFSKNTQVSFRKHFKRAFNIYVGCGKQYSRQTIVDLLCLNTLKTIENWGNLNNDCLPSAYNLEMLKTILPPGFKSMIEDYFNNDESKNICLYRVNTDLTKFIANYAGIIEDGTVDRQEKKLLKIEIPEVIEKLQELLKQISEGDK